MSTTNKKIKIVTIYVYIFIYLFISSLNNIKSLLTVSRLCDFQAIKLLNGSVSVP